MLLILLLLCAATTTTTAALPLVTSVEYPASANGCFQPSLINRTYEQNTCYNLPTSSAPNTNFRFVCYTSTDTENFVMINYYENDESPGCKRSASSYDRKIFKDVCYVNPSGQVLHVGTGNFFQVFLRRRTPHGCSTDYFCASTRNLSHTHNYCHCFFFSTRNTRYFSRISSRSQRLRSAFSPQPNLRAEHMLQFTNVIRSKHKFPLRLLQQHRHPKFRHDQLLRK